MTWAAVRRFWPAIPVLLLGLWVARLDHLRAGYREKAITCASGRLVDRANGERDVAKAETAHVRREAAATATYAETLAAREPLIIRSTNTVREYANSDAGRVLCRAPERVRAIDELDAELARPSSSAGSGAGAVRDDAPAPAS
ncbi:hypothetical protein [Sphingomonas sp. GM_Shp_2]|uniref:hypothetical protein n=1 Tax=Sphingomonas sp. GM_Shp_2 TaxID=2937380 RepID=UPI00226A0F47|nr:hypothetical protein [Sphingomonas sp. GM_Shp_2]